MSYTPTEQDLELINKMKLIEERVWSKYFPEEGKILAPIVNEINRSCLKNVDSLEPEEILIDSEGYSRIKTESYRKSIDKTFKKTPRRIEKIFQKQSDKWKEFLPKLMNVYALEIKEYANFDSRQKIMAMVSIRDGIKKIALFLDVDLFTPYQVALAYLEGEIKSHEEKFDTESKARQKDAERQREQELYYWPGTPEQFEKFYHLLLRYKLIEPNPNDKLSFQEIFVPENRISWIGKNKQLIYLLFLLYNNKRLYKGMNIQEIAVHVFDKKYSRLHAGHLNTQLGRLIIFKNMTVIRSEIDAYLLDIESLIKDYTS